jgi:hypothetical protein
MVKEELTMWRNRYKDIEEQSNLLLTQPAFDTSKYETQIKEL